MCWCMPPSSQDPCHAIDKALALTHIGACSIAEMLECTSLMAFVGAGVLLISEPLHAVGCKTCGCTSLDVSHEVCNLCRGAASIDT